MRWLRSLGRRLRSVLRRDASNRELREELHFHLDRQTEENLLRGMAPGRARAAALASFGSITAAAEASYQARGTALLDDLGRDLRFSLRSLAKQRAFTATAVCSLALGIGACTAMFSLVNAVLIRSLPYGDPGSLAYLYTPSPHLKLPAEIFGPSVADFIDLQRGNHSFESMTLFEQRTFDISIGGEPHRIGAAAVDKDFFRVLEVEPRVGRVFRASELVPGGSPVVLISDALWRSAFNARKDILAQVLRLDGKGYQIVGVMPAEFAYPHRWDLLYGNGRIDATELWLPYIAEGPALINRDLSSGNVLVRLKQGVTLARAQAEMAAVMRWLSPLHTWSSDWGALLEPFRGTVLGQARALMLLLLAAIGFVLLVACGNAANLFMARAAGRKHELGMRAALGARPGQLLRQMLTEALVLSSGAGIVGAALAWVLLHAMLRLNPGDIPRMGEATLDRTVLGFLFLITLVMGLLFGVLPALAASRVDVIESLKDGGKRALLGGSGKRTRKALAIFQIALVVVLLTGAGLFLRSLGKVLAENLNISPSTLTANVEPNRSYNTSQKQRSLIGALLQKIGSIHGVESVGMISQLPLTDSEALYSVLVEGYPNEPNQFVEERQVTPDYLSAMQIPQLAGRGFTPADRSGAAPVALVNESFVRRYLGNRNPLGSHLRGNARQPWITVVGVIGDVRNEGLEAPAAAQVYFPFLQNDNAEGIHNLAIRSRLPNQMLIPLVRRAVHAVDPTLPIEDIQAVGDLLSHATARRRFQTMLLTTFASLALTLAIVGVYGLLAYSVRQRTGEIGLRMALGSTRGAIIRLFFRESLTLLSWGLLLGMPAALAFAHLLKGFLYGVPAFDPVTFVLVPAVLAAATISASLIPSLRAAAVEPVNALRHE